MNRDRVRSCYRSVVSSARDVVAAAARAQIESREIDRLRESLAALDRAVNRQRWMEAPVKSPLALLLLSLALFATPARALTIAADSVRADASSAAFSIDFSGPPDFWTHDQAGRPKDSFQVFIAWTPSTLDTLQIEFRANVVVRGDEIAASDEIVVRDVAGDGGPGSGGWGPVRGVVPFALAGDEIRFTIPYAILGDSDGSFSWMIRTYEYGGQTDERFGVAGQSPTPVASMSWGGLKRLYR